MIRKRQVIQQDRRAAEEDGELARAHQEDTNEHSVPRLSISRTPRVRTRAWPEVFDRSEKSVPNAEAKNRNTASPVIASSSPIGCIAPSASPNSQGASTNESRARWRVTARAPSPG